MGQATEKHDFFASQPEDCRKPMPYKELPGVEAYIQRVLFYDPTGLYARLAHGLNPFNRYNWQIQFAHMFPRKEDGTCACGCGEPARVGVYANKDCQMFAVSAWNLIGGRQEFVGFLFEKYFGDKLCMKCRERKWTEIDHIRPVSHGGGGCWLSNFQALCKKCHTEKTRSDFNWVKLKTSKDYE